MSGQLETVAEIRMFVADQDYQDSVTLYSGPASDNDVTVSAAAESDSNIKLATSSIWSCAYSEPEDHSKKDLDPIRLCLSLEKPEKPGPFQKVNLPKKF